MFNLEKRLHPLAIAQAEQLLDALHGASENDEPQIPVYFFAAHRSEGVRNPVGI